MGNDYNWPTTDLEMRRRIQEDIGELAQRIEAIGEYAPPTDEEREARDRYEWNKTRLQIERQAATIAELCEACERLQLLADWKAGVEGYDAIEARYFSETGNRGPADALIKFWDMRDGVAPGVASEVWDKWIASIPDTARAAIAKARGEMEEAK
uniref:Uncharacterized protein n=1 Tax=viral metagenome TaxID=1070528 RepID=A0A6M3IVT4_9ZZZZ